MTGFAENLKWNDGIDGNGVRTVVHFEGDQQTIERQQDMTEALLHVRAMRYRNSLRKKGEHMEVGHIPWLYLEQLDMIPDPADRKKAKIQWLKNNPAFVAYPAFLPS